MEQHNLRRQIVEGCSSGVWRYGRGSGWQRSRNPGVTLAQISLSVQTSNQHVLRDERRQHRGEANRRTDQGEVTLPRPSGRSRTSAKHYRCARAALASSPGRARARASAGDRRNDDSCWTSPARPSGLEVVPVLDLLDIAPVDVEHLLRRVGKNLQYSSANNIPRAHRSTTLTASRQAQAPSHRARRARRCVRHGTSRLQSHRLPSGRTRGPCLHGPGCHQPGATSVVARRLLGVEPRRLLGQIVTGHRAVDGKGQRR